MSELRFSGKNGLKPQTEARHFVYRVLAQMLAEELATGDESGFLLERVKQEPDKRRLRKAIEAVKKELERKGGAR